MTMRLEVGGCYAVLLADGTVLKFRFSGDKDGQFIIECPPGSGTIMPFHGTITAYQAYGQIPCPGDQSTTPT
jgi:hypothetical protein